MALIAHVGFSYALSVPRETPAENTVIHRCRNALLVGFRCVLVGFRCVLVGFRCVLVGFRCVLVGFRC
ncbi:MAG: hypothetical protein GY822_23575, partial [Deltaproteobacteria bacterium]|nr:hypothetical protein [Deltaproteobacteria bacterium]